MYKRKDDATCRWLCVRIAYQSYFIYLMNLQYTKLYSDLPKNGRHETINEKVD